MRIEVLTGVFFYLSLFSVPTNTKDDFEGRMMLEKKLFENYDETVIPNNVIVKVAMYLEYLDADTEKNELEAQIYFVRIWTDSRLTWDSSSNGINSIVVPLNKIWSPDGIIVYNSADFKNMANCYAENKILIFPSGTIEWVTPCQLRTHCKFTSKDACGEQKCQWKFTSWFYDQNLLGLGVLDGIFNVHNGAELDEFQKQNWEVLDIKAETKERRYGGAPNPFSDLIFTLKISKIDKKGCA